MSEWDGKERRRSSEFCGQHIGYATDIATIKQSVLDIKKEITTGGSFRSAIITAMLSMGLIIVIQIVTFAYLYGQTMRQVEINTKRLDVIEGILRIR